MYYLYVEGITTLALNDGVKRTQGVNVGPLSCNIFSGTAGIEGGLIVGVILVCHYLADI